MRRVVPQHPSIRIPDGLPEVLAISIAHYRIYSTRADRNVPRVVPSYASRQQTTEIL
jgi:hypothetical protein